MPSLPLLPGLERLAPYESSELHAAQCWDAIDAQWHPSHRPLCCAIACCAALHGTVAALGAARSTAAAEEGGGSCGARIHFEHSGTPLCPSPAAADAFDSPLQKVTSGSRPLALLDASVASSVCMFIGSDSAFWCRTNPPRIDDDPLAAKFLSKSFSQL